MKKTLKNAVTVGLLTVGIVTATYFASLYLSEEYSEDTLPYYALFTDATGLVGG